MAKYGDIEISDGMVGKLCTCPTCKRAILVEEFPNGVSHTLARTASCWDCLTVAQRVAATKYYNINP
jgi:hypothetical protein